MGARNLGEIADYCNCTLPTIGLITNCGKAHIGNFGGEQEIIKAKGELYNYLIKTKGLIFYNSKFD